MNKKLKDIKGIRLDGADSSKDNPDNFYKCEVCGDMVYVGNLGDVFLHEKTDHK